MPLRAVITPSMEDGLPRSHLYCSVSETFSQDLYMQNVWAPIQNLESQGDKLTSNPHEDMGYI